jgi:hypothetical protein
VVVDGQTGLLVEPGQPEPLAAALLRLLEQPELAARLGAAGRRRAAEQFSLERMVGQTEALYERLLAAGRTGSVELTAAGRADRPAAVGGQTAASASPPWPERSAAGPSAANADRPAEAR